jgi:hypothetical protein
VVDLQNASSAPDAGLQYDMNGTSDEVNVIVPDAIRTVSPSVALSIHDRMLATSADADQVGLLPVHAASTNDGNASKTMARINILRPP